MKLFATPLFLNTYLDKKNRRVLAFSVDINSIDTIYVF